MSESYLPIPYDQLFKNRTVIIMGVGRSGTTILGKLLASMVPTYYLFEPTIFKTMRGKQHLATLFEDYFLPIVQGRPSDYGTPHYGNPNEYWATSLNLKEQRKKELTSRIDAIIHVTEEKPLWIVKVVNSQPYAYIYRKIFSNCHFMHIVRNGLDVVKSSIGNKWYSDGFHQLQNEFVFEGMVPWYVEDDMRELWKKWNPLTRAAYMWCHLVRLVPSTIRYEELCENPEKIAAQAEKLFDIKRTKLTETVIDSIERHTPQMKVAKESEKLPGSMPYQKIKVGMISEPVKSRFIKTMTKMGYEV